jgi:hypothetical protein
VCPHLDTGRKQTLDNASLAVVPQTRAAMQQPPQALVLSPAPPPPSSLAKQLKSLPLRQGSVMLAMRL